MGATKTAAETVEAGLAHHKAGRTLRADELYQRALRRDPRNANAWYLRSVIAMSARDNERAIELLLRATTLAPDNAVFLCNLGEAHRRLGQMAQAQVVFRRAVAAAPHLAEAHYNLGLTLHESQNLREAIGCYETALRHNPGLGAAESRLIRALHESGRLEDAIAHYHGAETALPESAELHDAVANALANTFRVAWFSGAADGEVASRLDQSIAHFRRALELDPRRAGSHRGLALALHDRGDLEDALAHLRRSLELDPEDVVAHSNLVFLSAFQPDYDDRAILDEARQWSRQHEGRVARGDQPHPNQRDPERRLRIGYVSPNFRDHCQSLFFLPLVSHHDHQRYEIFGYSLTRALDSVTARIRQHCDTFRDVAELHNEELARLVREDQIDILVDLTMHMGDNRALLFARKPAPVQICWLAYPGTTGLDAMDYRVTDVHLDPPGDASASLYCEKSLWLPDSFWCYDPLTETPEVGPLPALAARHITFGSLNTFRKMNEATVSLWAPVLSSLPDARLILLAPPGEARARVCGMFARRGVDPQQVEFVGHQPRSEYLATYRRIDLCLDPIPANGHTTSLDAFWMGVPVVTLIGSTLLGRAGLGLAENLGMPELVAKTAEEFAAIATRWASDLPRLAAVRRGLRAKMEASRLMDAPRFVRNMELAYRSAWRAWCEESLAPAAADRRGH